MALMILIHKDRPNEILSQVNTDGAVINKTEYGFVLQTTDNKNGKISSYPIRLNEKRKLQTDKDEDFIWVEYIPKNKN